MDPNAQTAPVVSAPEPVVPVVPIPEPVVPVGPIQAPIVEAQPSYVENIGGSIIDLLKQTQANPQYAQEIAKEMNIPLENLNTLLSGLMAKIDQGTLTKEELALIITVPILEEPKT